MSRPSAHDKVQSLPLDKLKNVAGHLKIKFHPDAIETDLVRMINQQPVSVINAALVKADEPAIVATHSNSREQVEDVIANIVKNKPEFQAVFDDESVTFKYKGAEDSCNLQIPLRVIRSKAEVVSRGRIAPRSLGRDGTFGASYVDTILT